MDATIEHDILVVGAPPETFQGENLELLRNPRVIQWAKPDVRDGHPLPPGITTVIYNPDSLGKGKTFLLKSLIDQRPNLHYGENVHENKHPDGFRNRLAGILGVQVSPNGDGIDAGKSG